MRNKELLKRIEDLEKRVLLLEQRPTVIPKNPKIASPTVLTPAPKPTYIGTITTTC